eukprot:7272242-Alexandrium_andersonii.AAC.1
MSASLVGSEMCIRDSSWVFGHSRPLRRLLDHTVVRPKACPSWRRTLVAVSYTHLTLPTICSV